MSKTESDQRVRLTKMLIKNAFVEILQQKRLDKITVREICDKASVNRGTFYNHYVDAYDLMRNMQNELLETVKGIILQEKHSWKDNNYTLCYKVFSLIKANREFVSIAFDYSTDEGLAEKFVDYCQNELFDKHSEYIRAEDLPLLSRYFLFVIGGCFSLMHKWVCTDSCSLSVEQLSMDCGNLISFGWSHIKHRQKVDTSGK